MSTDKGRVGVVMAGGTGERFWPMSTAERPKQLLSLTHESKSMLEEAIERIAPLVTDIYVSTSSQLAAPIAGSGLVQEDHVFAEPARRNTLGALVWTVANLIAIGHSEATVAVVTSDHQIGEIARFRSAIAAAMSVAERNAGLVTLGVHPTRPETGYGYIQQDASVFIDAGDGWTAFRAEAFHEKPDENTAQRYLDSGVYFWNSGMLFFTIPTFLEELRQTQPRVAESLHTIVGALTGGDGERAELLFHDLPNISVDHAVMETAQRVYVTPVDFPWDDVGSWDALSRTLSKDDAENVVQGLATIIDSQSCVVVNEVPGETVAILGLQDIVVVNTKDAVLVCHRSQVQRVRQIVESLNREKG